jgi:polyisoprenoid-binding protein YceI
MKISVTFWTILLSATLFTACNNAPEGQSVEAREASEVQASAKSGAVYQVDANQSRIMWEGAKPTNKHNGSIQLKEGQLIFSEGQLVGGSFIIDMNSIEVLDLQGEKKMKLTNHLTSGDFFETDKFPTASFEITEVSQDEQRSGLVNITGNLTMRDITKSITIPAKVQAQENQVFAKTPPFTINRTEWGVNYDSGILGTAKDVAINDNIGLETDLVGAVAEQ